MHPDGKKGTSAKGSREAARHGTAEMADGVVGEERALTCL